MSTGPYRFTTERDMENWLCYTGLQTLDHRLIRRQIRIRARGRADVLSYGPSLSSGAPCYLLWELKNVRARARDFTQIIRYAHSLRVAYPSLEMVIGAPSFHADLKMIASEVDTLILAYMNTDTLDPWINTISGHIRPEREAVFE